jgi:hypothetical protein
MQLLSTEMQAYADNALLAGSFRVGSIIGPIGDASGKAERAGSGKNCVVQPTGLRKK